MKELSIEEKAKAYDEAIERYKAKQEYESQRVHEFVEYLFPELKESEDERIRKAISQCVEDMRGQFEKLYKVHHKDAIAWLDKQCEQKHWVPVEPVSEDDKLYLMPDEQKPADKVEPKFHEGDWVVKGDIIAQILDVQEQYYVGLDTEGKDFTASRFLSNDKIHLWTIKDAKDGDILATLNHILIFEAIISKDGGVSYCHYDFGSSRPQFDFNKDDNWYFGKEAKVYPATKEQRDLLFKKMHEAGYEWDGEKKELKKIEQKPAGNSGKKSEDVIEEKDMTEYKKGFECGKQYVLKYPEEYSLCKKIAWSEEDESNLQGIIDEIKANKNHAPAYDLATYNRFLSWLKSLKDRVLPQPKQEWSEEDEQYLLVCKNALRKYQVTDKWDSNIISQWLDNKLKSLRPQSTWKPSDEQIEILEHFVRSIGESGYASPYDNNTKLLYSLLSDLKKLKG